MRDIGVVVGEIAERPVDRQHAVGAAGGDDGRHRVVPRVGIVGLALVGHVVIRLGAADPGGGHAHRGGEIGVAEAHPLHPGAGGGDLLDMGEARGGLDDDLEADRLRAALGALHRRHQRVDRVDVLRVADHRDHDLVEPVGAVLEQLDHVLVPPGRVEPVDPDAEVLVAPVDVMGGGDDVRARGVLVARRRRCLRGRG